MIEPTIQAGAPRPAERGGRRIVVGVDGSPSSDQALRWADALASARAAAIHVVHAWHRRTAYSAATAGWATGTASPAERAAAGLGVRRALERALGEHPSGAVVVDLVEGAAQDVLLDASRGADLLVLGAHEPRHGATTVRASLIHHCVDRATCPVLVVHADDLFLDVQGGGPSAAAGTVPTVRPHP